MTSSILLLDGQLTCYMLGNNHEKIVYPYVPLSPLEVTADFVNHVLHKILVFS